MCIERGTMKIKCQCGKTHSINAVDTDFQETDRESREMGNEIHYV